MNLFTNLSQAEFDYIFTDALIEIVSKISGFSLSVMSSEPDDSFGGAIGIMNLMNLTSLTSQHGKDGQSGGTLFISADEEDMRVLCSFMTGVPKDSVTKEDVYDALCELANMTAGNAKLRLGGGQAFALSTPFAIAGGGMSLVTKKRTGVISRRLGNETISLRIKVIYNN